MKRIGIDVGLARIGVSVSTDSLCLPHSVLRNDPDAIPKLLDLIQEVQASVVYVGLPLSLSGSQTASTRMALEFASQLSGAAIEIRMVDERLTSVSAKKALQSAGKNSREQKPLIDAVAASLILEFAIETERQGAWSGLTLEDALDR
ncbi:MAG: Holliday junction resolvase RuvX [Aquiluna sp.]|nr:Holliday junction resolvase RuvX [Aquiluna sp.]